MGLYKLIATKTVCVTVTGVTVTIPLTATGKLSEVTREVLIEWECSGDGLLVHSVLGLKQKRTHTLDLSSETLKMTHRIVVACTNPCAFDCLYVTVCCEVSMPVDCMVRKWEGSSPAKVEHISAHTLCKSYLNAHSIKL